MESKPFYSEVREKDANVLIYVSGSYSVASRVTVRIDGALAVDVVLDTPAGCFYDPGQAFFYDLPVGEVDIDVGSTGKRRQQTTVPVLRRPTWIVVSIQEDFPMDVIATTERPGFPS